MNKKSTHTGRDEWQEVTSTRETIKGEGTVVWSRTIFRLYLIVARRSRDTQNGNRRYSDRKLVIDLNTEVTDFLIRMREVNSRKYRDMISAVFLSVVCKFTG